jgi:hypothetical protein
MDCRGGVQREWRQKLVIVRALDARQLRAQVNNEAFDSQAFDWLTQHSRQESQPGPREIIGSALVAFDGRAEGAVVARKSRCNWCEETRPQHHP